MPQPKFRSRSYRRIKVTTPGGINKTTYKPRKPKKITCARCGTVLPGVAREIPSIMRSIPKSSRRPERPYGGVLCSKCSREELKNKAREL